MVLTIVHINALDILDLLTPMHNNIDFNNKVIHIENNLHKINQEILLLPTKTDLSQGSIKMPNHLVEIPELYKEKQTIFKKN